MNRKELFVGKQLEASERTPTRPLGEVSDFVVQELPKLVTALDKGNIPPQLLLESTNKALLTLSQVKVRGLLRSSGIQKDNFTGETFFDPDLDQAALDLKMLEVALVTYGLVPPEELYNLVTEFAVATGQQAMLSYEDLIHINPQSDPRTFTMGEIGNSERDFYFGHLRIDQVLEEVIRLVKNAIYQLARPDIDVELATTRLSEAVQKFKEVQKDLIAIGMNLPQDHFAVFRKFLGSHPSRGLKGPSGAFTAMIPILDLLLGGENLGSSYFEYLDDNELYFPRFGRVQIVSAKKQVASGETLNILARKAGSPPELMEYLELLRGQLKEFRGQHYKGVKYQIPLAINGNIAGTGGEMDPGTFLRARMKLNHLKESNNAE